MIAGGVVAGQSAPVDDGARAESKRLRAIGLAAGYNLDHAQALDAFRAAMQADPDDPAPHRLFAATLWIGALFQQGAVTAEDYLGQARSSVARKPPSADVDKSFREQIQLAIALAERQVQRAPSSADAHFQLGAAHSFLASYIATVEGRGLAAFGAARRAFDEHERVLALDAARKDAGMVVGMYRYGVSTLSLPWRIVAGLAGFGGGKDRGLHMLEEAAAADSDVRTNARFALIVIYNRERRYDAALQVVGQLQETYPRNRLLWLERASTLLRAGRGTEARAAIERGLAAAAADSRPRAFGEEARWRYVHGVSLLLANRLEEAQSTLQRVLTLDAPAWLDGRAHLALGKVDDLSGRRAAAMERYRQALRIAKAEHDGDAADEASKLLKAPYRAMPEVSRGS